jgi:MinD-like ATPase involved in chromosome partitioning or flagellar assembly
VGAPGRTTTAVNLAAALAGRGEDTVLVDVDTYGSSISQVLGLLDDAPGVAAACRSASAGSLDAAVLARIAVSTPDRLCVLTGVSADRWPELSPAGLEQLWRTSRELCAWTVVDTGPVLEEDEELSYDTRAPRRNAATLSALRAADQVILVGRADPVGLARLLRALEELRAAAPGCVPVVVVTAVRAAVCGADPVREIRRLLARHAAVSDPVIITDDRAALDAALLRGGLGGKKSITRAAMSRLAARLSGAARLPSSDAPTRRASRRRAELAR